MKIVSIVGARPQFVKAAALSRELRKQHREILVHTGQHYDDNLSRVFFAELDIPEPDYNLGIGSGPHGVQTGAMLAGIEKILIREQPAWVLIYGDTNSTLAGALAAAKLHIPAAHVEAGLRSFNRRMPEEINRVVADHLSALLFCPSQTAVDNLAREGISRGVHLVGDVMADALAFAVQKARGRSRILATLGLTAGSYLLATVHRAENTDDLGRLQSILTALDRLAQDEPVIFPVHPRTHKMIEQAQFTIRNSQFKMIPPVGYLDMVSLEASARIILTDSGGIQKESYWLKVPCITLRDETEWVETVATGWNHLAGADTDRILARTRDLEVPAAHPPLYGEGAPAKACVRYLAGG